jgi:phenylacetate-CoA ligase
VSKHQSEARIALDLWRAEREGASGLARRQKCRLAVLLAHARTESPFYRHLYRGLPADGVELRDLPPSPSPN